MKFVSPWMLALLALVPVMGAAWLWLRARTERRLDGFVAPALRARLNAVRTLAEVRSALDSLALP